MAAVKGRQQLKAGRHDGRQWQQLKAGRQWQQLKAGRHDGRQWQQLKAGRHDGRQWQWQAVKGRQT